jgi:hypothetical protein
VTAAINASDGAIETVPRDRFWYNSSIGDRFDFDHVNMGRRRQGPAPAGLGRRRDEAATWRLSRQIIPIGNNTHPAIVEGYEHGRKT